MTDPQRVAKARRVGRRVGSWVATGSNVAAGYVWARHGIQWGAAVYFGTLVVGLAVYGALKFPWGARD